MEYFKIDELRDKVWVQYGIQNVGIYFTYTDDGKVLVMFKDEKKSHTDKGKEFRFEDVQPEVLISFENIESLDIMIKGLWKLRDHFVKKDFKILSIYGT